MIAFSQLADDASPNSGKRLKSITVEIRVTDCKGVFYITDMLLQGGSCATGWVGHSSEVPWTNDG